MWLQIKARTGLTYFETLQYPQWRHHRNIESGRRRLLTRVSVRQHYDEEPLSMMNRVLFRLRTKYPSQGGVLTFVCWKIHGTSLPTGLMSHYRDAVGQRLSHK